MIAENAVDVAKFWRDGYTIVRGAYTRDEVARLREAVYASRGGGPRDLLCNPRLRSVLTDGRMVDVSRQLLDSDDLWYAGDSSYTINSGQRGFHKDNTDRKDPNGPDWAGRYTILRFGVYLQDHYWHTGGLNLRAGSHTTTDHSVGRNVYVRTRPGDIAVWSMCITHSGNGALLRFTPWVHPLPRQVPKLKRWMVAKPDGDRIALFAAIGLDDAHHQRYVDYLRTRKYMVDIWRHSVYDDETLAEAAKAGLHVRDMRREIAGDETVGHNVEWAPIPY